MEILSLVPDYTMVDGIAISPNLRYATEDMGRSDSPWYGRNCIFLLRESISHLSVVADRGLVCSKEDGDAD